MFLKPRPITISLTIIISFLLSLIFSNLYGTCKAIVQCPNQIERYPSYLSFIGKCGQTCSQSESILSLIILIAVLPIIYIILSAILRKR